MSVLAEGWARAHPERRYFLVMALVIAATVFGGFGVDIQRPEIRFASAPLEVYVHGAVFAAWIVFFVLQSGLAATGAVARHRQLGWVGAALAALLVAMGLFTTVMGLRLGRVPPFFPPGVFLVLDVTAVVVFGGLTAAAIVMRGNPDWHRRLMLGGTIMVMSPALGRILPMAALGPLGPFAVTLGMLVYVAVGMVFDRLVRGRIHPAYYWVAGAIVLAQVLIGVLGFSPPVLWMSTRLAGG